MSVHRGRSSGLIRFFAAGAAAGGAMFMGLWLLCLLSVSGFSVMGVEAEPIARVVFGQFLGSVIWIQVRILAAYVIVGALLGLGGAVILSGLMGWERSTWWAVGSGVTCSLVFEILFLVWAVRKTPQLYADFFYLPGGWRRQVMVFVTDVLPWWVAPLLVFILGGVFLVGLVVLIWRQVSYTQRWGGWTPIGVTLLFLIAGMAVIGGWRQARAERESAVPGILILAADSFRLDHLSGMGYFRSTSPAIDSLMSRGTVFTQAITPLPRTFPAWVSYLTGTYPHQHGVRHMFPTVADREGIPETVPEILGEKGWHSGVISDFAGDIFPRIDLGFRMVQAPDLTFVTLIKLRSLEIQWAIMPYANTLWGRAVFPILQEFAQAGYPGYLGVKARRYLKARARREEPFLLAVFFSATHFPYSSPDPFYRMFSDPDYQGDYKYHKPNLLTAHEDLTDDDKEQILALYDGAVRAVDHEVGKILTTLREAGRLANTWIIILADHGENLYEGELGMGHGEHLRGQNVLRVPLIIIPPRDRAPKVARVEVPVSGVDIAATLLDMVGEAPDAGMAGWSLLPLIEGKEGAGQRFRERPVFAETGLWFADWTEGFYQHQRIRYPDVSKLCELDRFHQHQIVLKDEVRDLMEVAKHRMVLRDTLKLIVIPTREGVLEEAYRIAADGSEILMDAGSPVFGSLREALYDELVSSGSFERIGDHVIPEGWYWRLNRRVTMH